MKNKREMMESLCPSKRNGTHGKKKEMKEWNGVQVN